MNLPVKMSCQLSGWTLCHKSETMIYLAGLWEVHQQQCCDEARQPKQQKSGTACQVSARSCDHARKMTAFTTVN